jgi:hypothetical protein
VGGKAGNAGAKQNQLGKEKNELEIILPNEKEDAR